MPSGRVESLAHGAQGVVRVDGKVHFVRHVAPGDEVELTVREDHGTYAHADVARVLTRGAAWREPPCPHLPRCGGCPWQQVVYPEQLLAKERAVRELLARIGGLPDAPVQPVSPAPDEYRYRRRLSLRVEGRQVGFFAGATHDLVPIDECLLASPALVGGVAIVGELVRALRTVVKRAEVATAGDGRRLAVGLQAEGRFVSSDAREMERAVAARAARVAGVALRGKGWREVWGDDRVVVPLPGGDSMTVPIGDFTQVGEAGNETLLGTVLELAAVTRSDRVLDLFCGGGNLSIPLARAAARVDAVERSVASVEQGRANARRLGLANLEFHAGTAAGYLRQRANPAAGDPGIDLVVLDPPRSGAAEAIPALLDLRAPRVVYVSCEPATLARDLRQLSEAYVVETVQPIDLFPQTPHVETVARLRRRERGAAAS